MTVTIRGSRLRCSRPPSCWRNAAQAHPHVWVAAKSEVVYAPDGSITGVRHAWTFDDMFSAYALQGLETKNKGVYSREELAPLAQTNVESLKEYGYFTFAKADGKKQKFVEPVDYCLEYKDTALTLHFTLPLKMPVKPKELELDMFDPTYFVDFEFDEKDPIKLVGAPAACKLKCCGRRTAPPTSDSSTREFRQRRQIQLRRDVRQQDQVDCP